MGVGGRGPIESVTQSNRKGKSERFLIIFYYIIFHRTFHVTARLNSGFPVKRTFFGGNFARPSRAESFNDLENRTNRKRKDATLAVLSATGKRGIFKNRNGHISVIYVLEQSHMTRPKQRDGKNRLQIGKRK